LLAFREIYNATWLIERHGFRPPAAICREQLPSVAKVAWEQAWWGMGVGAVHQRELDEAIHFLALFGRNELLRVVAGLRIFHQAWPLPTNGRTSAFRKINGQHQNAGCPANSRVHVVSVPHPSGPTVPIPVTTIRAEF
jgi:hypothetical protein